MSARNLDNSNHNQQWFRDFVPFFSQTTPNKCSPSDCVCFDFQIVWFRSSNKGCPLLCLSFHFRMCAPKFVACKYSIINYCVNFPIDVIFLSLKLCPISPWLHSWGVISIDWEKKSEWKAIEWQILHFSNGSFTLSFLCFHRTIKLLSIIIIRFDVVISSSDTNTNWLLAE